MTTAQATAGVTSCALNGNHDMYAGGWGYFDHLLADRRFGRQRAGGDATSFFRLKWASWSIVGFDTSWDPDVLTKGHTGVLRHPQAERLARSAAEPDGGKILLLSHHQSVTEDDPRGIGADLQAKVKPLVDGGHISAWMRGQEHHCIGFLTDSIKFLRCVGHGGVSVLNRPPRTTLPGAAVSEVTGDYEAHAQRWGRFGFAVLDFARDQIDVRYCDDAGGETHRETIT